MFFLGLFFVLVILVVSFNLGASTLLFINIQSFVIVLGTAFF